MSRSATQGFALAAIRGKVFAPEALVLPADSTSIPTGYGNLEQSTLSTHVPFVARVDQASGELENKDFSGPEHKQCFERKASCILPRAVVATDTDLFVACADDGVIHGAHAGAVVIDCSTMSPTATVEFAQRLKQQGSEMLDSPVSGGPKGAQDGTLSCMIGGDAATVPETAAKSVS